MMPTGEVPLNYQADLLDPLGRTVMISFRKLFLPSPSFFRQERQREQQQGQQSHALSSTGRLTCPEVHNGAQRKDR